MFLVEIEIIGPLVVRYFGVVACSVVTCAVVGVVVGKATMMSGAIRVSTVGCARPACVWNDCEKVRSMSEREVVEVHGSGTVMPSGMEWSFQIDHAHGNRLSVKASTHQFSSLHS